MEKRGVREEGGFFAVSHQNQTCNSVFRLHVVELALSVLRFCGYRFYSLPPGAISTIKDGSGDDHKLQIRTWSAALARVPVHKDDSPGAKRFLPGVQSAPFLSA